MSIESFIKAMPKVEINLQLEGAMPAALLLNIASRNDVADGSKQYRAWEALVKQPDPKRVVEIAKVTSSWLKHTDDLKRVVYEVGLALAKQNVRYAEIAINPTLYEGLAETLDALFAAINDGSRRVKAAWGMDIAWLLVIPREEPRRAEELVRYAKSAAGRQANIVGIILSGKEESQPTGQFERSFKQAEKQNVPRAVRAGETHQLEGVLETLESLAPNRIVDARGLAASEDAMRVVAERNIAICVGATRAVKAGFVKDLGEIGLHTMLDQGIVVSVGQDMPALYETTLDNEYLKLIEAGALTQDSLEDIALNAVRGSFLEEDAKTAMIEEFKAAYAALREQEMANG